MWTDEQIDAMRAALLDWYDREGRTLPWRVRPEDRANGATSDPYAIWLSEIMLQQTTVPHGTPYWHKFLRLYPTVADLAAAPLDEVLTHWAGLGYYARARNLHKCANVVVADHGGMFPQTYAELIKLPGIGDYTASTIAAICFDEPTTIVDGNVERVIARLHRLDAPLPKAKPEIKRLAAVLSDPDRPGDYGQAVMDLGATICMPRSPSCLLCPWNAWCLAFEAGDPTSFPKKVPKKAKPVRHGQAFVMRKDDTVWLRRRDEDGLLGGMMEVPGSAWTDSPAEGVNPDFAALANWTRLPAGVRHVFTHFELRLEVFRGEMQDDPPAEGRWVDVNRLDGEALPSLYAIVLKAAGQ
ncbi:MAG: A/G-specific adenine glycosylase [Litorimonas sp.]